MFGNYITFPHLLIFFPLIAGLLTFFIRKDATVKAWALFSSIITLVISLISLKYADNTAYNGLTFNYEWLKYLGSSFSLRLDGVGRVLTFLTALSFPIIFTATYKTDYKNSNVFYGLMLLAQCGFMGVFTAADALIFYFFWGRLALIPVYFLCSRWGGEKRIQATFKFFIYTFTGSLLMLIGIIFVYLKTAPTAYSDHSFAINAFYMAAITASQQDWLFWLFFIAFAIKMPIFPFHTWQPDTYEQSSSAVTMVLSGVMVKMGLFAVIRWLLPVFPLAAAKFDHLIIALSVTGIVYASLIALQQDDLKRLVAYSSIAHIGLMNAAIFAGKAVGIEGVLLQMFNHGINIIGMWIVVDLIEKQLGIRKISQLSGIANKAPGLTIALVIIALANIALPLTNAFIGEFMMFSGLFSYSAWFAGIAGISIILSATYTLNMVRKVFYGETNTLTVSFREIALNEKIVLGVLVVLIFVIGIYPQPIFNFTKDTVVTMLGSIK